MKETLVEYKEELVKSTTTTDIIDLEELPSSKTERPHRWIADLGMTQGDKEVLLSNSAWLSDAIVNAAQDLLRKRNPSVVGLQNVNLGLTFDIQTGEFVQILHTGHSHWHTVSTIGTNIPEVNVYDSMYCFCSNHSKVQIASILQTKHPAIRLHFLDVQKQSGEADCGLFAIAFATALSLGLHPGAYIFDQSLMRSHLLKCFESGELSMFPVKKTRRASAKVKKVEEFDVYCTCRMPVTPASELIQCAACKEWYHTNTCVQVEEIYTNTRMKWLCFLCK